MANYRVLYASLKTGTLHGELPVSNFEFDSVLNRPGACRGRVVLEQVAAITDATFEPARTSLYVERDGTLLWGGILWTVQIDPVTSTLTFGAEGFHSYFTRRILNTTKTYSSVDQHDIARDLIDWAQSVSDGSIGVTTTDTNLSGVTRDRTYYGVEFHNIGSLIENLAAVQNGFDFRYDTFYTSSGNIETAFRTIYPATGRATSHVFELGVNIDMLSLQVDGSVVANRVISFGKGQNNYQPQATVADASSLASTPLLDKVLSLRDVIEQDTVQARADWLLARSIEPTRRLQVEVHPNSVPSLGSYIVGDLVRIRGDLTWTTIDSQWRITSIAVSVDDKGNEIVRLSLVPAGAFL